MILEETVRDIGADISFRDWLTILGFVVGVTVYIVGTRFQSRIIGGKLEMMDATIEDLKEEVKVMQKIVVTQAQQTEQIINMDQRLILEGRRVDRIEAIVFKIPEAGK